MKFKSAKKLIPRFLKTRMGSSHKEVNLLRPQSLEKLSPKNKFLAGQIVRFDVGVQLLRHNFCFLPDDIKIPFIGKNASGQPVMAWYFKNLEAESFLQLFHDLERIHKKIPTLISQMSELVSHDQSQNIQPKYWVIVQEMNDNLESLLPYLSGIHIELYKLKINQRGKTAVVSVQKLLPSLLCKPEPKLNLNKKPSLPINRQGPAVNAKSTASYSSLLDPTKVDHMPKLKANKKETPVFHKATITQEEMRDFLSSDDILLNEEDDVTDPFVNMEMLRNEGRRREKEL